MKALYLDGAPAPRDDLPLPEPGPGEALVRVHLAGVCATDLALIRGYAAGFRGVPGHEFVGEVAAAPCAPERVGERVVGEINIACGHCTECAAGRRSHCRQREVIGIRGRDGAFAEYLRLPLGNLHPVPAHVSDETAVFTEPLAAALEVQQQLAIQPDQRVLVIGAGRLGQLIARVLRLTGCELRVVARHPRQRKLLAATGVEWTGEEAVAPAQADVVVEASGTPGGFELARRAVRPRGTICLKSTYETAVAIDLSALVVNEITLVGSRCGPFPPALRLLALGLVDPTPLIDARLPLDRAAEALERAARPGTMKVLIECRPAPDASAG